MIKEGCEKKSALFIHLIFHSQISYSFARHYWNLKRDWVLWSDKTKKKSFLAANTQDGFGAHRDKKYPMCTMKYTAVFLMLWAYFSARDPGHLVQTHGIMDSNKYQQIKIF